MKPVPGAHRPETGTELDLLLRLRGRRWGFELKCSDAPTMTESMHIALQDLRLERLWVLCLGKDYYPLHERVRRCRCACWNEPPWRC